MKKYIITLTEEERKTLGDLTSKGTQRSQKILNALILLDCDEGEYQTERSTNEEMARVLHISTRKIDRVKKRFVEEGFDAALDKKVGSRVYAKKTDGDFEAHLVALSCGEPPEGFARWSLRLLADKVVELNYIDSISHESVRRILKKTKSSHGNERDGLFHQIKTVALSRIWKWCWMYISDPLIHVTRLYAWTNLQNS